MRLLVVSTVAIAVIAGAARTSARAALPPDLVLYASDAATVSGTWQRVTDASAAGGTRLWHPDAGAAKIATPAPTPRDYVDLTFQAEAGRVYRLWVRAEAQNNAYTNDSVYVQFSGTVDASNQPVFRIGTADATTVVLENCGGCGLAGWGWQDNEYGGVALGPELRFATTGPQTLRIQAREDGISVDQIVLSSGAYFTVPPGALKNDTTILAKTPFTTTTAANAAPVALTELRYAETFADIAQAADMNGDGLPDVVGLFDSEPILLRTAINGGGRAFRSGPEVAAGGGGPFGAVAVALRDYNNDGRKDVLFLDRWFHQLVAVPGDGAGAFGASVFTTFAEEPADFAAADFNGDGKLDVVVSEPARSAATVYLGDGAGHFSFVSFGTTAADPSRLAVGDLDGDGRTDVAVVSRSLDTVTLLYGDGTGRFRAQATLPVPGAPRAVAITDVTGDRRNDLVVTRSSGVSLYLSAPGGDWQPRRDLRTTATFTGFPLEGGLAVADINGDGVLDLVVDHAHNDPRSGPWNSVSVLYGLGGGSFSEPDEFSKGNANSAPVVVADIDGDGRADLLQPDANRGFTVLWNAAAAGNHPPVASAGANVTVGVSQQAQVILTSTSTDPDGHLLQHSWKDSSGAEVSIGTFARPFGTVLQPAGTYTCILTVNDLHGATSADTVTVTLVNDAPAANTAPVAHANASLAAVWPYEKQFQDEPDPETVLFSTSTDADGDPLAYEWHDEAGALLGTTSRIDHPRLAPGTHTITLTVRDGRGGTASDSLTLVVKPYEEIYISGGYKELTQGAWQEGQDTGAGGNLFVTVHDVDMGAPKVTTPLASPAGFAAYSFVADPTVEYKLWIRLKAQNNHFGNDSVWVQFTGAVDAAGNPVFRTGTTSGLEVVLEECSGCGISGWGWRDDAWGARGAISSRLLRFPEGGVQTIRIQTREDGASVDQVVLSARKYKTTRPGAVSNDNTFLPFTAFWGT